MCGLSILLFFFLLQHGKTRPGEGRPAVHRRAGRHLGRTGRRGAGRYGAGANPRSAPVPLPVQHSGNEPALQLRVTCLLHSLLCQGMYVGVWYARPDVRARETDRDTR